MELSCFINLDGINIIKINKKEYYLMEIPHTIPYNVTFLVNNKITLIKQNHIDRTVCNGTYGNTKQSVNDDINKYKKLEINLCIEKSLIDDLRNQLIEFTELPSIITNNTANNEFIGIHLIYDYLLLCNIFINYLTTATRDLDNDTHYFHIDTSPDSKVEYFNYLYNLFILFESISYNKYNFTEIDKLFKYKEDFLKGVGKIYMDSNEPKLESTYESNISGIIKQNIADNLNKYEVDNSLINNYGFSWAMMSCWFDSVFWIIFTNKNMIEYFKKNLITNTSMIEKNPYYFNELNNLITDFYAGNHSMQSRNDFLTNISWPMFETYSGSLGTADYAFLNLFNKYTNKDISSSLMIINGLPYASLTPTNKEFYLVTFKQNNLLQDQIFIKKYTVIKPDGKKLIDYSVKGSPNGKELINIDFFKSDDSGILTDYYPIGILIHTGSHYTAISKAINDIWYYYDDYTGPTISLMNNKTINYLNLSILYWKKE